MRSQESLDELRYLRRIQEEVEDQWRAPRPDLDRLHRVMALLYTSHGLVWKSHGCSGSGEHDPFASEIVELALRTERSAQHGAHRAFNLFEEWRCESCSWNHNALYTLWATSAADGDIFLPLDAIDDHRLMHQGVDQGGPRPAAAGGARHPQQRRQHSPRGERPHHRAAQGVVCGGSIE